MLWQPPQSTAYIVAVAPVNYVPTMASEKVDPIINWPLPSTLSSAVLRALLAQSKSGPTNHCISVRHRTCCLKHMRQPLCLYGRSGYISTVIQMVNILVNRFSMGFSSTYNNIFITVNGHLYVNGIGDNVCQNILESQRVQLVIVFVSMQELVKVNVFNL